MANSSETTALPDMDAEKRLSISRRIALGAWQSVEFRIGLFVFLGMVLMAIFYPMISEIDPVKMNVRARMVPPAFMGEGWTWAHPLGTDQLGRDMLLRSLVGLRYSLMIGLATVVLMLFVGCLVGLFAGYRGGLTDTVLMRITDAQLSIPMIILAIAILGVARPTIPAIIIVLGLSGWPVYARVMRSVIMAERKREFVRGATVLGGVGPADHVPAVAAALPAADRLCRGAGCGADDDL